MSIHAAFAEQSLSCATLGSPFMGRLMSLFADRLEPGTAVSDTMLNWPGDPAANADNVPLRIAGGLHRLLLDRKALSDVYPPKTAEDDALWNAVTAALLTHEAPLLDALTRAPQTNEVRRAAAILPALQTVSNLWGLPVALIEIGCSGGLNLRTDHVSLLAGETTLGREASPLHLTPDWNGPCPTPQPITVTRRLGVDLAPIDATTEDGALRLLSYLWPDQPHRIERTRAALSIAQTVPAKLEQDDAGRWLARNLAQPKKGEARFVFHTIASQYFSPETAATVDAALAMAGERATASTPLARFEMEADGGRGAALRLTLWPGGKTHAVGRAGFHGQWVDWAGLP